MENFTITLPHTVNPTLQLPDPELVQYYEDQANRVIWILDEISNEGYEWIDFIIRCNREDAGKPIEERKPIKCYIANHGGSVEVTNTLVDVIEASRTPVYAYAIGMCASAASMIFLACDKRFAMRNATFMFHQGSCSGLSGTFSEIAAFMEDYQKEIQHLTEFYKTHTTFPPEVIEEKLQNDWYIYPEEGLENGVIDAIVTDLDELL